MLTGVLAGLGAGALWGLVFVMPRMLGGYSGVDLTAGRFVAYGLLAGLMMVSGLSVRRWPGLTQAAVALGMSWPSGSKHVVGQSRGCSRR